MGGKAPHVFVNHKLFQHPLNSHSMCAYDKHPAEPAKIDVAKAINKIKETAKCSGANPSQMYAKAVSQLDDYTRARMPVEKTLKRTIRNYRKKKNPIDPATLDELEILVSYKTLDTC